MRTRGNLSRFLPHPSPLPLGEGETDSALGLTGCVHRASDGRSASLSQRERAGVRENGRPVRCVPSLTINGPEAQTNLRRAMLGAPN
jgi:hypothetical protein